MKLNVYGRKIEIIWSQDSWRVFYLGSEGKKRLAYDINIPSTVKEIDLKRYIADLCHEWAGPDRDQVIILE